MYKDQCASLISEILNLKKFSTFIYRKKLKFFGDRILVDPSVEMQQQEGEYSLQLKCCLMNMERVSLGNDLLYR